MPYDPLNTSHRPAPQAGLEDEIDLLREAVRRLFEIAGQTDDSQEAVRALRAMAQAAGRLAALVRAQAELGRSGDDFSRTLTQALEELAAEMEQER